MSAIYGSALTRTFTDPDAFQPAVQGGDRLYTLLGRGAFRAELTDVTIGQISLQNGRDSLPRLAASAVPGNKAGILVWFGDGRLPVVRGTQVRPGELLLLGPDMQSHHRTTGPNEFASIMLDVADLAQAAYDQNGCDLNITAGELLSPPAPLLAHLLSIIRSVLRVGQATPEIFASPYAAKGLEEALLRAMVACLLHEDTRRDRVPPGRRAELAKKFEEVVEANLDRPLFSLELSQMIGISERSLRKLCQEQMGISPQRFLALRRLHLARQALLRADHHSTTVTQIAMQVGVWEFGRFAVAYKSLFGESPSATLRRTSPR